MVKFHGTFKRPPPELLLFVEFILVVVFALFQKFTDSKLPRPNIEFVVLGAQLPVLLAVSLAVFILDESHAVVLLEDDDEVHMLFAMFVAI